MTKQSLEAIRHTFSHVLMQALIRLYKDPIPGVGPAIEDGFYHDFDSKTQISADDLPKIEKEMKKIIKENIKITKKEMTVAEGLKFLKEKKYKYGTELAQDLKKEGEKNLSFYEQGEFINMCKGPHLKSTGDLNSDAFKLTKVAGAYWKGDEKNPMLQRIYGVAFETAKELKDYLKMMEEAEKRDHRKIGKELSLFMISEEVGQGLVMYLPKGAFIKKKLEDYMYEKELKYGYSYVITPVLAREEMYKKSGHLAHYREDMYNPIDIEGENYYLKPMNCPHHHIIYKRDKKSYRNLPLRYSDISEIHRYERSGVLTGLIRTRNFNQNDAHIYCTKDQIEDEFIKVLQLFDEVYKDFGIKDYWFELSLPDFNNEEKFGDIKNKEMWNYSADVARKAMKKHGAKFVEVIGGAAFYGPKIDVQIKNVFGKPDTIATVQVDLYSAEKFDLTYMNEKGKEERPVIIHRAIMGSFGRFFAFLIEQTGGSFPVWLSPVQAKILPVSDKFNKYGQEIMNKLKKSNIRVEIDDNSETLGKKIREAEMQKVPYILVVGEKERKDKSVAVRKRVGNKQDIMKADEFIEMIKKEIEEKK